jgi:hypothetical protein
MAKNAINASLKYIVIQNNRFIHIFVEAAKEVFGRNMFKAFITVLFITSMTTKL